MEKKILKEPHFVEEVLALFRSGMPKEQLLDELSNYHENDIAGAIEQLIPEERKAIYPVLGPELISEIFAYIEDPDIYLAELNIENAAEIISNMDSDDAVDVIEEMDDEVGQQIV